ncbi:3-oxoacyl-[acyl-carrier protein] reductase [Prauserella aidingensis]|nr:3-oxoacyl-[acyl-carrier protein] reductase [Prauserella aidingensis]
MVVADIDGNRAKQVADEVAASGAPVSAVSLDVRASAGCRAGVDHAVQVYGGLDVLICSAGIGQAATPAWEQPEEDWLRVIDVNLNGVWRTTAAAVPELRRSDRGRIVLVSSVAGKEGNPHLAAYSASKAGVIGLTKSLGKELGRDGVLVNAVTPAVIDTPMVRSEGSDPAVLETLLSKIPMGRLGTTEEVAELVAWLASPSCSFTTGGVFDLSGGRSTY